MTASVTVRGERVEVPCVYPARLPGSSPAWKAAPEPHTEERWLRLLEEAVEGRRFEGGMKGKDWADYWAKIPEDKKLDLERGYQVLEGDEANQSEDESEYDSDTPDPSGGLRRQQLKRDSIRNGWDAETCHYHTIRLENRLIAEERNKYEDAIGDQQYQTENDELGAMFSAINSPESWHSPDRERDIDDYHLKLRCFERLEQGEPKDLVLADWRRQESLLRRQRQQSPQSLREHDGQRSQMDLVATEEQPTSPRGDPNDTVSRSPDDDVAATQHSDQDHDSHASTPGTDVHDNALQTPHVPSIQRDWQLIDHEQTLYTDANMPSIRPKTSGFWSFLKSLFHFPRSKSTSNTLSKL
ncbi:hypothetical protein F503_00040 [Ophiostoma piceae UAMH 11346]|uniref:Uncharacterized protein n=1 Tax=Ophiostoma piceae (strain UAMH 11346) TaxID=1262450 RepID=S3BZK0_OPHP1|nr:hypothetical protein F503_00040 [Ophiostoma piceae UAMH 11346]